MKGEGGCLRPVASRYRPLLFAAKFDREEREIRRRPRRQRRAETKEMKKVGEKQGGATFFFEDRGTGPIYLQSEGLVSQDPVYLLVYLPFLGFLILRTPFGCHGRSFSIRGFCTGSVRHNTVNSIVVVSVQPLKSETNE